MATILNKISRRSKPIPLACSMSIENEPGHIHTSSCFIDIQPLSIVELFRSQGCASCPPAVPKILESTMDPNLLLLSYDITYFDDLGWTDTFGNAKWDKRQKDYAKAWGVGKVFTPQVVVDGVANGTGAGEGEMGEIVSHARAARKQMQWHIVVDTNDTELRVDSDGLEVGNFDICLVNYDPKMQVVKVKKGPNKGKKVTHRNLVKEIAKIGEWHGGNLTIVLPDMRQMVGTGLETVAVVQGTMGGPLVAAQKV